jgi:hypothetical protein
MIRAVEKALRDSKNTCCQNPQFLLNLADNYCPSVYNYPERDYQYQESDNYNVLYPFGFENIIVTESVHFIKFLCLDKSY